MAWIKQKVTKLYYTKKGEYFYAIEFWNGEYEEQNNENNHNVVILYQFAPSIEYLLVCTELVLLLISWDPSSPPESLTTAV